MNVEIKLNLYAYSNSRSWQTGWPVLLKLLAEDQYDVVVEIENVAR